jgi:hypothetical protein
MITKSQLFTVDTASQQWSIELPAGAIAPTVDGLFNLDNTPLNEDFQTAIAGVNFLIDFGLSSHTGKAKISWFEEGSTQTISTDANNVTINVTQNAGGTVSDSATFPE